MRTDLVDRVTDTVEQGKQIWLNMTKFGKCGKTEKALTFIPKAGTLPTRFLLASTFCFLLK